MAQERIFNLLKPAQPPTTAWDKIYEWLLGKARIVILLTELVIAVTFVFKVVEDTSAKNKEKQIEQQTAELNLYAQELEPRFRQIQNKGNDYVLLWAQSSNFSPLIDEVFSYMENPSAEVSVRVSQNAVTVFGFDDLAPLQKLEDSMKNSKTFSSVDIRDLTLEGEQVAANRGRYSLEATVANTTRGVIPIIEDSTQQ